MIIPIGDENPVRRLPIINYTIIAFNVMVFITFYFRPDYGDIVNKFGFKPGNIELTALFTSMFLHGGLFHLAGNMLYLWIFGDNVEDILGFFYIPFYLLAGVAASVLHTIASPETRSMVPCIGASGAISGVLGFYMIIFPWRRVKFWYWIWYFWFGTFYLEALWAIGLWFGLQLLYGFLSGGLGGIAYWAHIGGFAFGVGAAFFGRMIIATFREKVDTGPIHVGRKFDRQTFRNPNLLLDKAIAAGNDQGYLESFRRLSRSYGERRIKPEYHLKAAEILAQGNQFKQSATIYERFLLNYPLHPMAPKFRYTLGKLYLDHLNRPRKGLRYLRRSVSEPGEGYSIEDAQNEIGMADRSGVDWKGKL